MQANKSIQDFNNFLTCVSIFSREHEIFIDQQACFDSAETMSKCFDYYANYVDDRVEFMSAIINNINIVDGKPTYYFTKDNIDKFITKTGSAK